MRALIQTAKIDALHKIRSQGFLVMLLAMAIFTMIFFPQLDSPYQTIRLGDFRGVYNSAWIGSTMAMMNVSFLPLILFYFLRGAIQEDSRSKRGEIFVATPLNSFDYLMGKALSNFAIGLLIVVWMTIIAVFMQLWIGEDRSIHLFHLLLPQLIHVLPMLLFISMVTLVFDTLPILRSSLGNVVYFVIANIGLVVFSYEATKINFVVTQMKQVIFDLHGLVIEDIFIGITAVGNKASIKTFIWDGVSYSEFPYSSIAYILASSAVLFIVAWLVFSRSSLLMKNELKKGSSKRLKPFGFITKITTFIHYIIKVLSDRNVFLNVSRQEFLLLIGNKSIYVWIALFSLWIAQWFVSITILFTAILPAVMLFGALVISSLGQRERSHGTQDLIVNAPLLMKVQYPAMIFAGLVFFSALSVPSLIRLIASEQLYSFGLLMAGYFCIVSAAILLGTLTRSNKMFEILFVIVWYMGPVSHLTYFDFIGVDQTLSKDIDAAIIFLCAGLFMAVLGAAIRKKTLR